MKKLSIYLMAIVMACPLIVTISISSSHKTDALEKRSSSKIYESISITDGDTLWTIASEHKPATVSTSEYVKEIKKINSLSTDKIHSGNNLIVYYYSE